VVAFFFSSQFFALCFALLLLLDSAIVLSSFEGRVDGRRVQLWNGEKEESVDEREEMGGEEKVKRAEGAPATTTTRRTFSTHS
jgi:hypothetical protein